MKKLISKILKAVWFVFGGLILLWIIFFYIKMHTINTLGEIAVAALFAVGVYILFIFLFITLLYYLIKYIIKKFRKR